MAYKSQLIPTSSTKAILRKMTNFLSHKELSYAAGLGTDIIAKKARIMVPVDTGRLKRAIVSRQEQGLSVGFGFAGSAYVSVDYGIAPHAHLVEYGARGGEMPAQPFMRYAVATTERLVTKTIELDLEVRLKKKLGF